MARHVVSDAWRSHYNPRFSSSITPFGEELSTLSLQPQISVIIPVFNGGEDLALCLQGVYSSHDVNFECIVVDDASTDGRAAELAKRFGARLIRQPSQQGPARARNAGAEQARADLLFFTDADVVLHSRALAKACETLAAQPELCAVFGSYDDNPGHPSFLSRYRNLYHHMTHQLGKRDASTFWSGCGAIRRAVFERMGGFNVDYAQPSIEDIELGYRLRAEGCRIQLDPDMQGQHLKEWTFAGMLRTDIFQRGVPWVLLLQRFPNAPPDLNLNWKSRISALLASLLLICVLGLLVTRPAATLPFFALLVSCLLAQVLWLYGRLGTRGAASLLAMLCAIAFPALAAGRWPDSLAWWPLALTAGLVALQAPFFRLVTRREGLAFALACIPQQIVFFLACAVSVPLGLLSHWRTSRHSTENNA